MNQQPRIDNTPTSGSNNARSSYSSQFLLSSQNLEFVKAHKLEVEVELLTLRLHTRVLDRVCRRLRLLRDANRPPSASDRADIDAAGTFRMSEDIRRLEDNILNDQHLRDVIRNGVPSFIRDSRVMSGQLEDEWQALQAVELLMAYRRLWETEDEMADELRKIDLLARRHLVLPPLPGRPRIAITVTGPDDEPPTE